MIIPGFIHLAGSILLFFTGDEKRNKGIFKYILSVLISLTVIIVIFLLTPQSRIYLSFLDYTLIPLQVDQISLLTGLIFAIGGLAAIIYTFNFAARRYLQLVHLFIGSALTVVFAGDLFTLYVFWELMTISSSFIIILSSSRTRKTGYYYFILHLLGGLSLLWGIFLQYSATGSLAINNVRAGLPFFLVAVAVKMAVIGFHTWLPPAYSKVPFYVSVILSIYTTKVGVYIFFRLLPGINFAAYIGLLSALTAIILALRQNDARRLLSYSIISHIGYMVVGISLGTEAGITGGIFHLFNHILYKSVLFMVIGVIIYTTGEENLKNLGNLTKKLPYTTGIAIIASLANAGVPFLNGYMSKIIIKEALNEPFLKWGIYLLSIGTSLVILKFMYYAFFQKAKIKLIHKPSPGMLIGMGFLTLLIIIIGVNPYLLENYTGREGINYFDSDLIFTGIQPFLWASLIFIIFRKKFIKKFKKIIDFDIYRELAKLFVISGQKLSQYHSGNLSRYLLWAITTLIILWFRMVIYT